MTLKPMFAGVAETYDFLNRLMTLGLDRMWRKMCARECASGRVVLDLCCGTGDLTFNISEYSGSETQIIGLDFSKQMLYKALNKKIIAENRSMQNNKQEFSNGQNVSFILADAEHLPFKDQCFDRIGISFSFRNLIYRNPRAKDYIKSILNALRPRGQFIFVETSQPKRRSLQILYHLYHRKIVKFIGGLVSGRKGAYNYLSKSAINFPPGDIITKILLNAGFRSATFRHMLFGAVGLFRNEK